MPIKTYREAVKEALAQEMEHDERVVLIGEDLRGGHGGNAPEEARIEAFGGVLGVTKGLWTQFGSERVIDTPITESAIVGMAAGAAATGLRPVAELMFMDFSVLAMMHCTTRPQSSAICLAARRRRRW